MEQKSMTALVSAFSRAYHSLHHEVAVFSDSVARQLFTDEEYHQMAENMSAGIGFFNPQFAGDPEQALRWIVDNQLSPLPLGRAAFAEKSLERAVRIGAKQYFLFGAGYDTFAYRQPAWAAKLEIFEIDRPATANDKQERLKRAGLAIPDNVHCLEADFTKEAWQDALLRSQAFDGDKISFCAIPGVSYYLSQECFEALIAVISSIVPKGSSILLDYPDEKSGTEAAGERSKKQAMLAAAANEKMVANYSYSEMERLLSNHDFLIYEHLTPEEMTAQYFDACSKAAPDHPITAFDHVNYCLAVRA